MNDLFEQFQKSISYQLTEKSRLNFVNIASKSTIDEEKLLRHRKIELSALIDVNFNVPFNEFKYKSSLMHALYHQSYIFTEILDLKNRAKYLKYPKQIIYNEIRKLYREASYRYYEAEQSIKYLYKSLKNNSSFDDDLLVASNIRKFNSKLKRLAIIRANWVHPEGRIAFNEGDIFSNARMHSFYERTHYDEVMLKKLFFVQKKTLRDTIDNLLSNYEFQLEYFYEIFHKEVECKGIIFS